MRPVDRWMFIAFILVLEIVLFVLPVGTLFAVYILIFRPPWFRGWVSRLYDEV